MRIMSCKIVPKIYIERTAVFLFVNAMFFIQGLRVALILNLGYTVLRRRLNRLLNK